MLNKSKIIRTAEKYVIAGKIAQAVVEYRKLIEQDPDEPTLLNTVGDLLVRQGRPEEALGYYRQVAELYLNGGFYVKAGAMLKKILQLEEEDLRSRELLAELYEKQGLRFEAAHQLQEIVQAHESSSDYDQALLFAKRLTEVLPTDGNVWRRRARIAVRAEKVEPAVEFYTEAIGLYQQSGDIARAWETLIEVFPLDSDNRRLLDLLVEVADSREQLLEAQGLLEREMESTGEDFPFRFYLGLTLEQLDEPEEAAAQYRTLQERGFHDRRVTEAMVRVGHLEPIAEEPAPVSEPSSTAEEEVTAEVEEAEPSEGLEALPRGEDLPELFSTPAQPPGDQESPSRDSGGSGLFDLEALSEGLESGGTFRLGEENSKIFEGDAEEALEDETEDVGQETPPVEEAMEASTAEVASLEEALEEVDFYLKLGFREDATNLLQRLLRQYPSDERVISRARKARIPVAAEALPATEPETVSNEPDVPVTEEESAMPSGFENEIENALDGLFTGAREERAADPALRYDIASTGDRKDGSFQVHYDLGLAYKEMGLVDDAVQEFRKAFGMIEDAEPNPRQILCCSMLASSYLLLERHQEAVEWAQRGLAIPDQREFETRALQYDLALALERQGQTEDAVRIYREIAARDADYRDVAARLEQLGP